jgi:uncharacterized circularly permuted ATP-grasp superfamily protein/uncharacterized alpha-E superfamily protein
MRSNFGLPLRPPVREPVFAPSENSLMLADPTEDFAPVSRSLTHPHVPATVKGLRFDVFDAAGNPRPGYEGPLHYLQSMRRQDLRALDEHMEATLREMGVTYGLPQGEQARPWICDLLPHIFTVEEWEQVTAGVIQRVRAFELFLKDIYGKRQILRDGAIPVHPVLGSPHYQGASMGLPLPRDAYLHLSGICLTRNANGHLAVKEHHMSRASGISYMVQNRRALASVLPDLFEQNAVSSLADALSPVVEALRGLAEQPTWDEPSAVLLSPGTDSPLYSEHSFLARRMGIPLVQGGDLLVLDDHVFLKTVRGLKRVDVIYNHVSDERLDSLVFKKGTTEGVPGIVHCLRRGTVRLVNALGSQLVDDASLLSMAPTIIRYYLHEGPILPTIRTYWLGDLDQLEMVLDRMDSYRIRPISAPNFSRAMPDTTEEIIRAVRKRPGGYVAQPLEASAEDADLEQDHIVFALRRGEDHYEVFPGALTRVFSRQLENREWISKDSWVPALSQKPEAAQTWTRNSLETHHPSREVTSRVAESFYWMGRYLERAYHQAYLIQAIETLESEELNAAERKLYRPMWNKLLPPLETSAGESRRSITTRQDRYRLLIVPEPGTVVRTFTRAMANAESIRESLSPEAMATLNRLRELFRRTRFRENLPEEECGQVARRISGMVIESIPQFFAIAQRTVLGDDGWRFCEAGELLERAIITSNAVVSISRSLVRPPLATEIQLSAFLRLLGTRDAYRRVYQMRAEPVPIIELLFQHPESPRSVLRCLTGCTELLRKSAAPDQPGASTALTGIEALIHHINRIDWSEQMRISLELVATGDPKSRPLEGIERVLAHLAESTLKIHHLISDGFLSHQAFIAESVQPMLLG